ncbi:MAG: chaperonin GroEL [Candidatus Vidania fulgoroideorum]
MSYKKIKFKKKAKTGIIKGINTLANAVKLTLGPKGKNVIIEKEFSSPMVTKDGVTVAKEIELKNKLENIGAQMLREVASKTNDDAGDGTTTATVLAQSIIKESIKYITIGVEPIIIKKQIEKYLKIIINRLNKISKKINNNQEIAQVGSISSNNDIKIGNMIAKAMKKIGKNGAISIEEGNYDNDELEIVKGLQFEKGYMSPYFLKDNKRSINLENVFILTYEKKIDNFRDLLPILEKVSKKGNPIIIICDGIENEILTTLIINNVRGIIKAIPIKAPGFGDRKNLIMEDISIVVGSTYIRENSEIKLKKIKIENLGFAKKIKIYKENTIIINGKGNKKKINERIKYLKKELENTTSEYDKEKINERISKLSGGIAIIKVGGSTEIEMKERKFRIEDALNATKAAIENGIVPGGGITLLRISEWMNKKINKKYKNIGFNILTKAMKNPFIQIMKNGGINYNIVLNKIKNKYFEYGFDLENNKFCNLVKNGIIDPTKVVIHAIKNAVSISCLIISSECAIYKKEKIKINKNNLNI